MIQISDEELLRIDEVAQLCRAHFATVFRWILKGVPGPDGQRVRLDAIRVGGKWMTTRSAVQRFAEATTPRLNGDGAAAPRSANARQRASERAAAELEKLGIGS